MQEKPDRLMRVIARFTACDRVFAAGVMTMARYCLMDALGCALQAFESADCVQHIGPIVAGTVVPHGARVPGTTLQLDPVKATCDISILIRWFDFNAVWYTGDSPADALGTVLAVSDYVSRRRAARGGQPLLMRTVLADLIKAYEIHGMLVQCKQDRQPRNRAGFDADREDRGSGGGDPHTRRQRAGDRQRAVEFPCRSAAAQSVPRMAAHRAAQVVGGGRRGKPCRAIRVVQRCRRNGLCVGAERCKLGIREDVFQRQALRYYRASVARKERSVFRRLYFITCEIAESAALASITSSNFGSCFMHDAATGVDRAGAHGAG